MRGSIRSKGKHSFQIQIYTEKDKNGKWKRYFETIRAPKKSIAQTRLNELLVNLEKNIPIIQSKQNVETLLNNWLESCVKDVKRRRTFNSYEMIIRVHLVPNLGHLMLKELTPAVIDNYYSIKRKTLSDNSVRHHHILINQACNWAVKKGLLAFNPCSRTDPPRLLKHKIQPFSLNYYHRIKAAVKGSQFEYVYITALLTGLRESELLGLRICDIDLLGLTVNVKQTLYKHKGVVEFEPPKTIESERLIGIPPELSRILREEYLPNRFQQALLVGKVLSNDDLLFSKINGDPLDPSAVTHEFRRIADSVDMTELTVHSLRHMFATNMHYAGVAIETISKALGHSTIRTTSDIYLHPDKNEMVKAAEKLDHALNSGIVSNNANLTPTT
jgi:integrase